jgi:hypothetical protein
MSHAMKITTKFQNGESLVKALEDSGVRFQKAADLRTNGIKYTRFWGIDDTRNVALAIERDDLRTVVPWAMDGMAFIWQGDHYDLLLDQTDQRHHPDTAIFLDKLRQRYAYHEVMAQVHAAGWTIGEVTQGEAIQIVIRDYSQGGY